MTYRQIYRVVLCALLAGGISYGAYLGDGVFRVQRNLDDSVFWARQVTGQVRGLIAQAQDEGRTDALGWAVRFLRFGKSLGGIEAFVVKATEARRSSSSANSNVESYELTQSTGIFEYQVSLGKNGEALRLRWGVPYQGFLGTPQGILGNLLLGALYFFMFTFLVLLGNKTRKVNDSDLKARLRDWIGNGKKVMTVLAATIRDVIGSCRDVVMMACQVAEGSTRAKDHIEALMNEAQVGCKALNECGQLIAKVEEQIVDLTIETETSGDKELATKVVGLHQQIQKTRVVLGKVHGFFESQRQKMDPLHAEIESSLQSFENLSRSREVLTRQIEGTTVALSEQISHFSHLKIDESPPSLRRSKRA